MPTIDETIAKFSPNRDHDFTARGETFVGQLGLDYEVVTTYMGCLASIDERFRDALNSLVLAFLGKDEYNRFDAWRTACRDEGNPLTIWEATLIGAKIVEEETGRPTRASSDSSTGRETSGDGSTGASTSPGTTEDRQASLSAVS